MRVAVLGSGVAGLTVAHELAERGFEVDIYERLLIPGGKARSVVLTGAGQQGLPGEHGFRFFPEFYRNVIDSMQRTPVPGGGNAEENLRAATLGFFARANGDPLPAPSVGPNSLESLITHIRDVALFRTVLSDDDIEFFSGKLWQVMSSCNERRLQEYDPLSWAEFIEADKRGEDYRRWFAGAMTRTLIAASGDKASAFTVGDVLATLLIGGWKWNSESDRLLDGPTNDAWIGPWYTYLTETLKVRFHFGETITALEFDAATNAVTGAQSAGPDGPHTIQADRFVMALPVEVATTLFTAEMEAAAPDLATAEPLGQNTAWMSGIQIYLREDVPIVNGHVVFAGSPWGLTSVSQKQFWAKPIPAGKEHGVGGVLSVDISDWNTKGHNGLTAKQCTGDQIAEEVMVQVRESLPELSPESLAPSNIHSYFIDPDIVFCGPDGIPKVNHEPLFINVKGTYLTRPKPKTSISNFYLAGDWVRTSTDLATMEGANEAGRRAVNAILEDTGSKAKKCKVWDRQEPWFLAPLRWLDKYRFKRGKPWKSSVPRVVTWLIKLVMWLTRPFVGRGARKGAGRAAAVAGVGVGAAAVGTGATLVSGSERTEAKPQGGRGPWNVAQREAETLFLHYKIDPHLARQVVPDELEIQEHDGSAWLVVIALKITDVRLRWFRLPKFLGTFPEIDCAVLVRHGDTDGLYFLGIEGAHWLRSIGKRWLSGMPYRYAKVRMATDGQTVHMTSGPRWVRERSAATFDATYTPTGEHPVTTNGANTQADTGTPIGVLVDQFAAFKVRRGKVYELMEFHPAWQVQEVDVDLVMNSLPSAGGVDLAPQPDMAHYSTGVSVKTWLPKAR